MIDYSVQFNKKDRKAILQSKTFFPCPEVGKEFAFFEDRGYIFYFTETVPALGDLSVSDYIHSYRLPWGE